jgi:hypothetical protein
MTARRQVLSFDSLVHPEFYHQTTPRKWRTYNYTTNVSAGTGSSSYAPSILYQSGKGFAIPAEGSTERTWIGKKLSYWTGDSITSYVKQIRELKYGKGIIGEYEIATFARPNIYRILFVDEKGIWKSKPEISYQAGRLNIIVGPDDVIKAVAYF